MGQPVKVSETLASYARDEAAAADRSLAAQIEHWAVLGRAAEKLLGHREVMALKRLGGGAVASVGSPRARIERALEALARSDDREAIVARVRAAGGPRFGVDERGQFVRVEPDGTRTVGTIVDGEFVAARTKRAKRSKTG